MKKAKDIMTTNPTPLLSPEVDSAIREAFPGLIAGELLPIG